MFCQYQQPYFIALKSRVSPLLQTVQKFTSLRGFSGGAEYCLFVYFQRTEPVLDVCGRGRDGLMAGGVRG